MLIPSFNLSQNDAYLLLKIKAPYTKISKTEIFFEGQDFRFYSKPYFLRLTLPGQVVENGTESATYDVEEGSFIVQIPKACPGEWFEGLDLQTKLLAPKCKPPTGPLIEVLASDNQNPSGCEGDESEEFNWEIYQNQYTEESTEEGLLDAVKYGFASQKTDIKLFSRLQEEMPDLLDVRVYLSPSERRKQKLKKEAEDFSEEHYLADLYEPDEISRILDFKPLWCELLEKRSENPSLSLEELVVFTDVEKSKMRTLLNKEYLLDQITKQQTLLSLVDILYAYAYNFRTTEGENTVESAWTICKISSTLSWLETFNFLESVVVSSVRRGICYPLYRHWNLAMVVLWDTVQILSLGPRFVLKCLLDIHSLFNVCDPRYVLNDLYITDYCVWIQTVKVNILQDLSEALKKLSVNKECIGLDLPTLEQAAELVLESEKKNVEDISNNLGGLQLESATNQTDDSSDSSSRVSQCESSDSETSDDESSSSLDSDDYSTTDFDDSSDDEEDSDPNEASAENCLLLGNVHSIEKIR